MMTTFILYLAVLALVYQVNGLLDGVLALDVAGEPCSTDEECTDKVCTDGQCKQDCEVINIDGFLHYCSSYSFALIIPAIGDVTFLSTITPQDTLPPIPFVDGWDPNTIIGRLLRIKQVIGDQTKIGITDSTFQGSSIVAEIERINRCAAGTGTWILWKATVGILNIIGGSFTDAGDGSITTAALNKFGTIIAGINEHSNIIDEIVTIIGGTISGGSITYPNSLNNFVDIIAGINEHSAIIGGTAADLIGFDTIIGGINSITAAMGTVGEIVITSETGETIISGSIPTILDDIYTRLEHIETVLHRLAAAAAHSGVSSIIGNDGMDTNSLISNQSKDTLLIFLLTLNTLLIIFGAITCVLWNKSKNKYYQHGIAKVYSSDDEERLKINA